MSATIASAQALRQGGHYAIVVFFGVPDRRVILEQFKKFLQDRCRIHHAQCSTFAGQSRSARFFQMMHGGWRFLREESLDKLVRLVRCEIRIENFGCAILLNKTDRARLA